MTVNIYDEVQEKCTGCSACSNVCPTGTIELLPGSDGFIVPFTDSEKCIGCGKCERTCPALHPKYENSAKPKLYAFRADDSTRSKSSSGGIFTLLAEHFIRLGGVVCGAAFDSDMTLRHIFVDNTDDLVGLRGSKYVQSVIGKAYSGVRQFLEDGRYVLFTGTPCQCAGLRNYLGKPYEKLFVLDLLCHGVPSGEYFHKYLDQKFKNKDIKNVRFRDKKLGWSCENIIVEFSDGTDYIGNSRTDPYAKAFFRNLDLRKSCEQCVFSQFPRQGDITSGDFWGISAVDKSQNDGKGTSIIYVNSSKGRELFSKLSEKCLVKEFPFEGTVIRNRIKPRMTPNVNRERFFKFMADDRNTFEGAVFKALNFRNDIGIVSNFYAVNFGGSLTQYALYHVLEDMGYNCLMIERPQSAKSKASEHDLECIYLEPPYPKLALSRQRKDKSELREHNNNCEMFVVGSDQLYQYSLYKNMDTLASLDWVDGTKKKIAYAASFGHDHVWGDPRVLSEMSYFIKRFDAFSVREKSGTDILKNEFGIDSQWVLDPVFMCDTKHYDRLIERSDMKLPKKYIASYILDPSEEKAQVLAAAEKQLKMKAKVFSEFGRIGEYTKPLSRFDVVEVKVEERLKILKNCDFVVTDSFHGTCFSIIMNKPFVSIMNSTRGASRFESLLSIFGLEGRLIRDPKTENWQEILCKPINFDQVNSILKRERGRCFEWLKNALEAEKRPGYSSYDVLIERICSQQDEINELKRIVSALSAHSGMPLSFINDPVLYFEQLSKEKEKYLTVCTVKDTPGLSVRDDVVSAMKKCGLEADLVNKHHRSYLAVTDGGKAVFEELSEGEIVYHGKPCGIRVDAASRNFKVGNVAKNIINGKDYAVNRRGLNVTVIDKKTGAVADTVSFDMHPSKYKCNRK